MSDDKTAGPMTPAEAVAALQRPGSPFEIGVETVAGRPLPVFVNRQRSLRDVLAGSLQHGDADVYIFDDGRRVTYRELGELVAGAAARLRSEHGIEPGDRVAILGANALEWIVSFWATVSLGAIAVGLNGWWVGDEIEAGLAMTTPKLLIADRRRLDRVADRALAPPVVVFDEDFSSLTSPAAVDLPSVVIDEDDPAVILFTSGTTGRPKGAVNTHRNIIAYLDVSYFSAAQGQLVDPAPSGPPPRPLASNPLFHVSGLHASAIATVARGISTVWTTGRFDAEKVLALTQEERITRWGGVATQIQRLVTHPDLDSYDLSSLQSIGGGGSTWSPELQRLIRERLPDVSRRFSVGYGLTECAALATIATDEMLRRHPDTVGAALPTVALRIHGDDGAVLPDGEIGEIAVRGPMVMPGYWGDEAATRSAIDTDGFLRTGDFGYLDDGLLFIASRLRDMIIRGGENIYPVEIENRLEEHPDIAEAAVVGVDHPELGEEVKAIVVPIPGASVDAETVREWVAQSLAYFKVPAHVDVRTEPLPRNASGKVLKRVLTGESASGFVAE